MIFKALIHKYGIFKHIKDQNRAILKAKYEILKYIWDQIWLPTVQKLESNFFKDI